MHQTIAEISIKVETYDANSITWCVFASKSNPDLASPKVTAFTTIAPVAISATRFVSKRNVGFFRRDRKKALAVPRMARDFRGFSVAIY